MSVNDHTGATQATKPPTDTYRHNYDAIFAFDRAWNAWIEHNKSFKPTNEEFARFFFNEGYNCK